MRVRSLRSMNSVANSHLRSCTIASSNSCCPLGIVNSSPIPARLRTSCNALLAACVGPLFKQFCVSAYINSTSAQRKIGISKFRLVLACGATHHERRNFPGIIQEQVVPTSTQVSFALPFSKKYILYEVHDTSRRVSLGLKDK